jgi:hypothetical protein
VPVKTKAKVEVQIESAGDHSFDLDHIRREGGAEVVETLLNAAGLEGHWRVRIDKKIGCTSHTKPISVTNYQPWGIHIKIKPGDNNTAHSCSLLFPEQESENWDADYAKHLCNKLKLLEDTANAKWRDKRKRYKASAPFVVTSTVPLVKPQDAKIPEPQAEVKPEPRVEFKPEVVPEPEIPESKKVDDFSAKKILGDPVTIETILFWIYKANKTGLYGKDNFMSKLRTDMKWGDATRHATGSVITNLIKMDMVCQVKRGETVVGYELEETGLKIIQHLIDDKPKQEHLDASKVLKSLGQLGAWFSIASKRIQEIETERELLKEQLVTLDAEEKEICAIIQDPKVQIILGQLVSVDIKHTEEKK